MTEKWGHINIKVPIEVADHFRGKREASRIFAQAALPLLAENGHSLASVTAQLRHLLDEDRAFHDDDMRRHTEINILQQRVQLMGGQMVKSAEVDAKLETLTKQFAKSWLSIKRAHQGREKQERDALTKCKDMLEKEPLLHERFADENALFKYFVGRTGPL